MHHFLSEQVSSQVVKLIVATNDQVVDIFTKPLPRDTLEYLI